MILLRFTDIFPRQLVLRTVVILRQKGNLPLTLENAVIILLLAKQPSWQLYEGSFSWNHSHLVNLLKQRCLFR